MGRMSCEEWMARLRRSVSGGPSRRFVGAAVPGRRVGVDGPQLVTVGEFSTGSASGWRRDSR